MGVIIAPLPLRVGPKHGKPAFTLEGEEQIFTAIKVHEMDPIQVAARVGASLQTIYNIVHRVESRRAEQQ